MLRECQERFSRHLIQGIPLVSYPGMHHGTCVTHVPWCMSGSLTYGGGENVPGITGACATRNFTYLARGPWCAVSYRHSGREPYALEFNWKLQRIVVRVENWRIEVYTLSDNDFLDYWCQCQKRWMWLFTMTCKQCATSPKIHILCGLRVHFGCGYPTATMAHWVYTSMAI